MVDGMCIDVGKGQGLLGRERRRSPHLKEDTMPLKMGIDAISQALNQISKSPLSEEIESSNPS